MPNTFNTLSGTLVLQEVLASLLVNFPVLTKIARDFSAQQAKLNQIIDSRVVVPSVAAAFDSAVGYAATNRTTADVQLTINNHVHHTFAVTDVEQSSTSRDLRGELVATSSHALGSKMVADLCAFVTAARYAQVYGPIAAANFARFDIRKIRTKMNKLFCPDLPGERYMLLNSDFAEGPDLDTVVIANPSGFNPEGVSNIRLPVISGFGIDEFASLPDNGEKLGGWAANREAILMAARVPDIPADPGEIPGIIQVVSEPNTNLTIQRRRYYDMVLGKLQESVVSMYGFGSGLSNVAQNNRLVRIVTP